MWKKILLGVFGLSLILFAALLIVAKVMITPERVRETVVPLLEESLHRELLLGDIDISLFSGIVLHDLVLAGQKGEQAFVAVDKAVLRYRVLPLFLLRIEVDEIRLERPHIRVKKFKDGSFNFSDLAGTHPETNGGNTAPSSPAGSSPVAIHVSEIVITDGLIEYVDETAGDDDKQTVSSLNLAAHNFSTTEPFTLSLSTNWNGNVLLLDGHVDLDDYLVDLVLGLNAVELKVTGDLLADAKGDRLRARINLRSTPVTDLVASIPNQFIEKRTFPDLSGQISAELTLDGFVSDPQNLMPTGQVVIDNLTVADSGFLSLLNGTLLLDRQSLSTEQLTLKLNDQLFAISARIDNLLQRPLKADIQVKSSRLDLDQILSVEEGAGLTETASEAVTGSPLAELGPFELPIDLTGAIAVEELLYRQLPLQNVALRYSLKNNLLTINTLAMTAGGGQLNQTGTVNLGVPGLRYKTDVILSNIKLNPIVTVFKPGLSKSIFGTVDGQLIFTGAGTVPERLIRNLSGNGNLKLTQARLANMPSLDSASSLLGISELQEVIIDNGDATFRIEQGVVALDLQTAGPSIKQTTKGSLSLTGLLGLKVDLALSPALTRKLDRRSVMGALLKDKEGWTHVPLRIKGSSSEPKVSLDSRTVREQATRSAIDSLADKLKKKVEGGSSDPESKENDDPASKLIDGALKGLFGN